MNFTLFLNEEVFLFPKKQNALFYLNDRGLAMEIVAEEGNIN
jgi:hypothetical protein